MPAAVAPFAVDPILRAGATYWAAKRGGRRMPDRRDIDILDMPREIIPYVVMAELLTPPGRVRYRIVGEEMVNRFGHNFTGKSSPEIFSGTYLQFIEGMFASLYRERSPVYSESVFRWDAGGYARTTRLAMPLAGAAEEPDTPRHAFLLQTWPQVSTDAKVYPRNTVVEIDGAQSHQQSVVDLATLG